MEAAGVIRGYTALVDPEKVGLHLTVMVEVNLKDHAEEHVRRFEAAVIASPHIARCQSTTGQADYLMTGARARHQALRALSARDDLQACPASRTCVRASCCAEIKSEAALPIAQAVQPAAPARGRRR